MGEREEDKHKQEKKTFSSDELQLTPRSHSESLREKGNRIGDSYYLRFLLLSTK